MRSSLKKLHNPRGEPTFPPEIAQICWEAYWDQNLCNAVKQCSLGKLRNMAQHYSSTQKLQKTVGSTVEIQNCAKQSYRLPWKNCAICPALQLSPEIVQFWAAVTCSYHKLHNPSGTASPTPPRNCVIMGSSHLLLQKLCNPSETSSPVSVRNYANPSLSQASCCTFLQVDWFPLGSSKTDLHEWVALPEIAEGSMKNSSLDQGIYS